MKKMLVITGIIVAIFGLLIFLQFYQQSEKIAGNPYGKQDLEQSSIDALDDPEYQNIITPDNLKKKLNEEKEVYVYFFSPICQYCQVATPMVNDVMEEEGVTMHKYSLLEFEEGWQDYAINGTPTLVHYKDGKEVARIEGAEERNVFSSFVQDMESR